MQRVDGGKTPTRLAREAFWSAEAPTQRERQKHEGRRFFCRHFSACRLVTCKRKNARVQRGKPQPKTNWPQRNTRITKKQRMSAPVFGFLFFRGKSLVKNAELFRIATHGEPARPKMRAGKWPVPVFLPPCFCLCVLERGTAVSHAPLESGAGARKLEDPPAFPVPIKLCVFGSLRLCVSPKPAGLSRAHQTQSTKANHT